MSVGSFLRPLRSPRWFVGAVVALIAVIVFVSLGLWQLERREQRRDLNAIVESRLSQEAMPFDRGLLEGDPADLEYLPVAVVGSYDASRELIVQARSLNGVSGHYVVTALDTEEGAVVAVNRGWVPADADGPPVGEAAPPDGSVKATGILRVGESAGILADDPSTSGRLGRLDLAQIAELWDTPVPSVYLQLESQVPAQPVGTGPIALPGPELGDGPHLNYAFQWFAFALIVLVGFPSLLLRTASQSLGGTGGSPGDGARPEPVSGETPPPSR